jgi:hypothetical protein
MDLFRPFSLYSYGNLYCVHYWNISIFPVIRMHGVISSFQLLNRIMLIAYSFFSGHPFLAALFVEKFFLSLLVWSIGICLQRVQHLKKKFYFHFQDYVDLIIWKVPRIHPLLCFLSSFLKLVQKFLIFSVNLDDRAWIVYWTCHFLSKIFLQHVLIIW